MMVGSFGDVHGNHDHVEATSPCVIMASSLQQKESVVQNQIGCRLDADVDLRESR
jgi:hypothetical protein